MLCHLRTESPPHWTKKKESIENGGIGALLLTLKVIQCSEEYEAIIDV